MCKTPGKDFFFFKQSLVLDLIGEVRTKRWSRNHQKKVKTGAGQILRASVPTPPGEPDRTLSDTGEP